MHFLDARIRTRRRTPDGFLRASAILTRSGLFEYDASELGIGPPGKIVLVERTRETLESTETLDSIRGAAVTLDHPESMVSPANWAGTVVGNVVGEPEVTPEGNLVADILIGRKDAIDAIEGGKHELSIGYDFRIEDAPPGSPASALTKGGLSINHVAVVAKGRAGPTVRVLDKQGNRTLDNETQKAIDQAIKQAMADQKPNTDNTAIAAAISSALGPVIDQVKTVSDAQKKAAEDAASEKAETEAKAAADKLIAETVAARDAYWAVVTDAMPMIPPDKRAELQGKPTKDILVAALTPYIPNASAMDEAALMGALAMAKAGIQSHQSQDTKPSDVATQFPAGVMSAPFVGQPGVYTPGGGWPTGVTGRDSNVIQLPGAQDASAKARDAYIKSLQEGYKGEKKA